ncbi:MAG: pantetheine-phosphate adenylyltransferase [Desulfobacula sp.]|uniref:pantetheine-phosphate adenylyltransferase n=1 Tax=Desulfobacula sp. TaxID=2593537 RepID=UPI001D37B783|nr:pantetheine-phosphate adenylyltransferase [Desulfobacula sp.]MBT3485076.1 pantetheine-phosphate adenylyltransferase [Desulfobacula sp.]MBT3804620.1 pantetheine-phosphate adenylyltransferase [Desulfobacula sp.]MBT4025087.1 pantetheine-phosphate adenylyltransferase [Desulfobacula sp.]MBT4198240.1 pantetheine-phosphate adenylyltransferase [Desulfobacula sp.]
MPDKNKIAIYPGSFDPLTNGHIDIIERALEIFDKVIIAVLNNPSKKALFTMDERVKMIKQSFNGKSCILVDSFGGLLVDYAKMKNAVAIIRGMRALSDFESEFQMALMNRKLNKDVQSVFLMTGLRWIFTSSSIIKEAAQFGGDITDMVPEPVLLKMLEKFPKIQG